MNEPHGTRFPSPSYSQRLTSAHRNVGSTLEILKAASNMRSTFSDDGEADKFKSFVSWCKSETCLRSNSTLSNSTTEDTTMPFLQSSSKKDNTDTKAAMVVATNGSAKAERSRRKMNLFSRRKVKNSHTDGKDCSNDNHDTTPTNPPLVASLLGRSTQDIAPVEERFDEQRQDNLMEVSNHKSGSIVSKLFSNSRRSASSAGDISESSSHTQAKVVYHNFGQEPKELLVVERDDEIPQIESPTDVIVKVQVR